MNDKLKYRSDFLFPQSSFFTGLGSILNIGGNHYNVNSSKSDQAADMKALKFDWGVIAQDFRQVLDPIQSKDSTQILSPTQVMDSTKEYKTANQLMNG